MFFVLVGSENLQSYKKESDLLLGQKLPSEKPTGAHTDTSGRMGRKVPEGGIVDSAVDFCPHSVEFLSHPDLVSFWIRNPTFFDLPELCLLW